MSNLASGRQLLLLHHQWKSFRRNSFFFLFYATYFTEIYILFHEKWFFGVLLMKSKFQFIKLFYNVQCLCVVYWFSTEKYLPFGLLEDTAVFMHLLWFKSYLCYNHILKSWVMLNLVCSSFVKVQWDWLYSRCCLAENINKKIN